MGLDMYLSKHNRTSIYDFSKNPCDATKVEITTKTYFADGETKEQTIVINEPSHSVHTETPVAYWRKANQIHNYFVKECGNGVDDCTRIYVSGAKLKELVDRCKMSLVDRTVAEKLLPTKDGFFFGSTDYDDDYLDDLRYTIDKLKDCDFDGEYIYQASW